MFYEYQDFSKKDKKLFKPLLTVGVNAEIKKFLKESLEINQSLVEKTESDIRDPFWELSNKFKNFSKELVKTYDGYSPRDLPQIITLLVVNGVLNEEKVLNDFSDSGKEKMKDFIESIKGARKK